MSFLLQNEDKSIIVRATGMTGIGSFTSVEINGVDFKPFHEDIVFYIEKTTKAKDVIFGTFNYKNDKAPWHRTSVITTEEFSKDLADFKYDEIWTQKLLKILNVETNNSPKVAHDTD